MAARRGAWAAGHDGPPGDGRVAATSGSTVANRSKAGVAGRDRSPTPTPPRARPTLAGRSGWPSRVPADVVRVDPADRSRRRSTRPAASGALSSRTVTTRGPPPDRRPPTRRAGPTGGGPRDPPAGADPRPPDPRRDRGERPPRRHRRGRRRRRADPRPRRPGPRRQPPLDCVKPFGLRRPHRGRRDRGVRPRAGRDRDHGQLALRRGPPRPDAPGRSIAGPASARRCSPAAPRACRSTR